MAVQRNSETGQPIITGDVANLQEEANALGDYARHRGPAAVQTYAELGALSFVFEGMIREVLSEQANYQYVSPAAGWVRTWQRTSAPFAVAVGAGGNLVNTYATVNFPVGRFTVAPWVIAMSNGATAAAINVGQISKDSMKIAGFNTATNTAIQSNWYWMAIQMTPTSASG